MNKDKVDYEALDRELENCRTCGHMFYLHHYFKRFKQISFCDPMQDYRCDCKEFIPEDNLKYLEWCYENTNSKAS